MATGFLFLSETRLTLGVRGKIYMAHEMGSIIIIVIIIINFR